MSNTLFPTLYARDSKGKILQWNIQIVTTGMQVDIRKSYGEFDGAQALRWQRNIQGKNIGKSNETSPSEQARLICESNIKRKKDKGYMSLVDLDILIDGDEDLELTLNKKLPKYREDASGDVKPMKCQQYYRSKKNWTAPDGSLWDDRKYYYLKNPYVEKEPKSIITKFPCMCQPKINGVRATIKIDGNQAKIKSKEGLTYRIPQILDYCNMNIDLFQYKGIDLVLDGELYIHGEPLSEISSAVKRASLITQRVVFILFDLAIPVATQTQRWKLIKLLREQFNNSLNCPIQVISTYMINNDKEAQTITDKFISQGYEGSIFRNPTSEYKFGSRPMTMTKLKRTISHEFTITNIVAQEKDSTLGNFQCLSSKGDTFLVTPKGTEEYKRELLKKKISYKGKKLTCTFYEWTVDMKPYHVIDNIVRDYE